jgi:hypothetical protein
MQRVEIDILRLRRYASDAAFAVYGDLGSGSIDYDHPLPPGVVPLWPAAAPPDGHLRDGHLVLRHLDDVSPDGHLQTLHLRAEHLYPAWPITCASPGYVFGRFGHTVRMCDGAGNWTGQSEPIVALTINSNPTVPTCCHRASFDAQADEVRLTFQPSRFAPIPGN